MAADEERHEVGSEYRFVPVLAYLSIKERLYSAATQRLGPLVFLCETSRSRFGAAGPLPQNIQ
jgi:hypothetical protein